MEFRVYRAFIGDSRRRASAERRAAVLARARARELSASGEILRRVHSHGQDEDLRSVIARP